MGRGPRGIAPPESTEAVKYTRAAMHHAAPGWPSKKGIVYNPLPASAEDGYEGIDEPAE